MFQGFINQGKNLNSNRKINKNEVLGIIEGFGGEVDRVNVEQETILQGEEDNLLRKMSALATDHQDFVKSNSDLLKETENCVKECQGAVPTKSMSYKEKKIHYQSCLAGCGANTSEIEKEDLHGVYKDYTNEQNQYDIDKCTDLKDYTYAPPPTKYAGESCSQAYQCYSTKCGKSGPCKGKCYVSGKSSSSFETVKNGGGVSKTYCNYEVSKLWKSGDHDFYFRVGTVWHKIEGYYSTYPPCRHCKDFTNDVNMAIQVMDTYGRRAYGMCLKKSTGKWTVVEDKSRGVAKPSWSRIKSMLLDLGAKRNVPTGDTSRTTDIYTKFNGKGPTHFSDIQCKSGVLHNGTTSEKHPTNSNCEARDKCMFEVNDNCEVRTIMRDRCKNARRNNSKFSNFGKNVRDPRGYCNAWSTRAGTNETGEATIIDGRYDGGRGYWDSKKAKDGNLEVGEGDADSNRDCKSGKYVERGNQSLESQGVTGNLRSGVDYCVSSEDNIGFDRSHWLWSKVGAMLQWCGSGFMKKSPFCDKCFSKGETNNLKLSLYNNTRLYGPWISWWPSSGLKIQRVAYLPDQRIVLAGYDGVYTKMICVRWGSKPQGRYEARYYRGHISEFNVNKWNTYRYAWTWWYRWTYLAYRFPWNKISNEKKQYGVLNKCTYENPTFPYVQFMSIVAPGYVKTDYAIGAASWYPRWWLDNKLDWAGWWTGWGGRWPYGAVWWGGKRRAEEICNDSKDCVGIFEFWKGWWAFLFPRKNYHYSSSGRRWGDPRRGGANVRQIWMKNKSNIKRPRADGDTSSRRRNNWNYWWWSTTNGRREYNRNQNKFVDGECYRDRPQRDLPHRLGYFNSIQQCKDAAKRKNLPYAGTQYGANRNKGQCWGGYNPGSYGKARNCNMKIKNGTKWGGGWAQNIYKSGAPTSGYESRNRLYSWASSGRRKHDFKFNGPKTGDICPANEKMLAKTPEDKRKVELNKN